MSYIEFKTKSGSIELSGIERHYSAFLCSSISFMPLSLLLSNYELNPFVEALKTVLDKNCYLSKMNCRDFCSAIATWWQVSQEDKLVFTIKEKEVNPSLFSIQLNTLLRTGSDPVKLLARLQGQCENHCFVRAKNKKWLVSIIEDGLKSGLFRKGHSKSNWQTVIDFLNINDTEDVVCSYSVCDSFPESRYELMSNFLNLNYNNNEIDEKFEEISLEIENRKDEYWDYCFKLLSPYLEIMPETFQDYYFYNGATVFDLIEYLNDSVSKKQ
ncbi:MAG: hypothetical protein HC836_50380 [Richelia sp. RM2_1_2]|nr:hypothetical protein [Richelia sp. RM2_1_2]